VRPWAGELSCRSTTLKYRTNWPSVSETENFLLRLSTKISTKLWRGLIETVGLKSWEFQNSPKQSEKICSDQPNQRIYPLFTGYGKFGWRPSITSDTGYDRVGTQKTGRDVCDIQQTLTKCFAVLRWNETRQWVYQGVHIDYTLTLLLLQAVNSLYACIRLASGARPVPSTRATWKSV